MTTSRDLFGFKAAADQGTHTDSLRVKRSNATGRCLVTVNAVCSIDGGAVIDPADALELAQWIIDTWGGQGEEVHGG